jgi:ankyrin repeat protein
MHRSANPVLLASNLTLFKGNTALMLASNQGFTIAVKALLKVNPSVEHIRTATEHGDTALFAVWKGHSTIAKAPPRVKNGLAYRVLGGGGH